MGTLYLVGTPIGNLKDVSERAREVLGSVDLVAAEDTRRAGSLLKSLGLRAPRFISFFEANEAGRVAQIVERLRTGDDVALVSDAGMPGVSDPGYRLVRACADAGIAVEVVPGPSAVLAALVLSGLPTDRFAFEGFLPRTGSARRERLSALVAEPRTVVMFESPRRVGRTLADLVAAGLGGRRMAFARELTKLHQQVIRGTVDEVLEQVGSREIKGEVALVLEGAPEGEAPRTAGEVADAVLMGASLHAGGLKKRESARRAARVTGVPAALVYRGMVEKDGPAAT